MPSTAVMRGADGALERAGLKWWKSPRPDVPLILYRPDTSDEKACREVIDRNAYQKPRLGFTLEEGDRWLDAGAHIGTFSALALHRGADRVVAVEPVPEFWLMMKLNTSPADRIFRYEGIVTPPGDDKPRVVYVREGRTGWRSTTLRTRRMDATSQIVAPAFPIDRLISAFDLDCVKLDIEGAEVEMLEVWTPPDTVRKLVFEWSFDVDDHTARLRSVLASLENSGFKLAYPGQVDRIEKWRKANGGLIFPNGILCYAWRE